MRTAFVPAVPVRRVNGRLFVGFVLAAVALELMVVACAAAAEKDRSRAASVGDDEYQPGPDSQLQSDVPRGKTFQFVFERSQIFPGTRRTITVYVPEQYKAERPACVYVGLDGLGFNAPVVFDNLIHKGEMPVVIGVGVSPGQVDSARPPENPRFNRSFEFDGLNDNLARCVLEEILPEVQRRQTPGGVPIRLSEDPNDRCTGGGSTGAIAAFTLAWQRPDAFRRVFTAIGTFVGMRGGDRYPVLVRKTEPKPLRVFMQDGSNDQWMGGPEVGDWWMSNQTMERALAFAGYQVEHVWGHGNHSGRHAAAIFPDAMRWLWKDWPQPVAAGTSQNLFLQAILQPGEDWQPVAAACRPAGPLASDGQGSVVFRDVDARKPRRISADGTVQDAPAFDGAGDALAFGPDGRWYAADADDGSIVAYDSAGTASPIADGIHGRSLLVTSGGNIYVSEPDKLWLVRPGGKKCVVDEGLKQPTGVAISPDGLWLAVAERGTHWGYSYGVRPDGSLQYKQRFYWFHVPDWADDSGVEAWCADRDGRLYAATRMGVQVFDRNGRVRCILPLPDGRVTGICFGGRDVDHLYVTCGGRIYRRRLKVSGSPAWAAPVKLPRWGAG